MKNQTQSLIHRQNPEEPLDYAPKHLSGWLIEQGLLSKDQLNIALKEQQDLNMSFADTLVKLGFLSEQTLNQVMVELGGFSSIDLNHVSLDHELIGKLPRDFAQQKQVLPLAIENGTLLLAMVDAYDIRALDQTRRYFPDVAVQPILVTASALLAALDRYYGYDLSIDKLLKEIEDAPRSSSPNETWVSPVVRLVESLIVHGIKVQASDIHFQPEETYVRIRYRIDGVLQQYCAFHKSYWSSICVRLKVLAQLNLAESRRPQSGRYSFHHGLREVDIRVSAHPTLHGESFVLRLLDKQNSLRSLEELGFTSKQVLLLKNKIRHPQGLFVITGPTGSGKTTTMYSILSYLSSAERNIMTLEQPIEYKLPLIRQTEISEDGQTSFAQGIRSILRQDPDIIFVGEIRDEETAKMALRAAMTGHLVFTTLHTNDSLSVIPRLTDLGIPLSMATDYLVAVVSQRLIRIVCSKCHQKGCPDCYHTGFSGRKAIGEVLSLETELRQALLEHANRDQLHALAKKLGFESMSDSAQNLVKEGKTTSKEVQFHLGTVYGKE